MDFSKHGDLKWEGYKVSKVDISHKQTKLVFPLLELWNQQYKKDILSRKQNTLISIILTMFKIVFPYFHKGFKEL